jgi:hypothetical protein
MLGCRCCLRLHPYCWHVLLLLWLQVCCCVVHQLQGLLRQQLLPLSWQVCCKRLRQLLH